MSSGGRGALGEKGPWVLQAGGGEPGRPGPGLCLCPVSTLGPFAASLGSWDHGHPPAPTRGCLCGRVLAEMGAGEPALGKGQFPRTTRPTQRGVFPSFWHKKKRFAYVVRVAKCFQNMFKT